MGENTIKESLLNYFRVASLCIILVVSTVVITKEKYKKEFYKEIVIENTNIVSDDINKYVDKWVNTVKSLGMWNETYQKRLDNIKWYTIPHTFMTHRGNKNNPLAITYFDYQKDGTALPTFIVLSDMVNFDMYGTEYVVFHELGHAILFLDDIRPEDCEHNYQIMWYQGLPTYEKFSDSDFMRVKLIEQILSIDKESIFKPKSHIYCSHINNK